MLIDAFDYPMRTARAVGRAARAPAGARVTQGIVLGALLMAAVPLCAAPLTGSPAENYQSGLSALRDGRVNESYETLRAVYLASPGVAAYRNDFIVAATDSGHSSEALAAAAMLRPADLPRYVLMALGRAARDAGQPDLAVRYYDASLAFADDVEAQVGRALAVVDGGKPELARSALLSLNARFPHRVDVLEALALANEATGRNVEALAAAQAVLAQEPHHAGALEVRFRVLLRLGAPQLALAQTPQELTTTQEQQSARRDQLAFDFRAARDDPTSDIVRARNLDAVIARMRTEVAASAADRDASNAMRGDLIEALAERGRAAEAITEYESLKAEGVSIPPYVTGAVAASYVSLRQPQRAAELFESLPSANDASYGARATYVYALLESGHYRHAAAWADALAASEPMYSYASYPELLTPNDNYAKALVLAGLVRVYSERPVDGEARLDQIVLAAPANEDAQLALAITYEMRGWPRKASASAFAILEEDPDATGPVRQLYSDHLVMSDWQGASQWLDQMHAGIPPDDIDLQRADRDWQTHEMAEIDIEGSLGRSHGGRSGVIDSEISEYLYSQPFAWNYRAYLHLDQAEGDPVQGTTFRHAVGAGIEYHTQDWLATGELMTIDRSGVHPLFNIAATPDDHWTIGGGYAERSLDVPIAATVVGVYADRFVLNATYRVSESREFGLEGSTESFSDGNLRRALQGFWQERWITGPVYKLDVRFDLDTSENSLADTNYFNPKRDFSQSVTFENQWTQFRHYDESLTHEVDFGIGNYSEQSYGSGPVALIRYQLVYAVNDRLTLKAGVGRSIRPFDGQRERLDQVTFGLTGRL